MKIAIVGAGAMGALYGVVLQDKGHDVYLIDTDQAHVDAMNKNGVVFNHVIDHEVKTYPVKAFTDSKEIKEKIDLLIILVKGYVTDVAMEANKHLIDDNTIVLTLQNGAGNIEKIEKYVPREQILAGTTSTAGFITEPGHIDHTGNGGTHIGEINGGRTERIEMIQELFVDPRLGESIVDENVMSLIWEKLIANCGINSVGSLTYLKNGEALDSDEKNWLFDRITEEALAVADKEGIKLSFNDSEGIKKVCRATAENRTSMMIDVLNKRKTEIDSINGEIVRQGRKHNIPTPINEALVNLVHLKEKSYLEFGE